MQRYDRQERLWSKRGQNVLENSHIWVIGKSMAINEALKNLTIAGLGNLTLSVDQPHINSFFDNKQEPLKEQLLRFNPRIFIMQEKEPSMPIDLILIAAYCWNDFDLCIYRNIPQIVIGSRFLRGIVSLQARSMTSIPILEPHPSSGLTDLRFHDEELWPEYRQFCEKFDLEKIDEISHRHVPFVVLIVKALLKCGRKGDLKKQLAEMHKYHDEDNFNEALKHIWHTKRPPVPPGVMQLIELANSDFASKDEASKVFWSLIKALQSFIDAHNCLPVSGIIPDMVSQTAEYTELKEIYQHKAQKDIEEVKSYTQLDVPQHVVKIFCENSRHIKALVHNPKYFKETSSEDHFEEFIDSNLQELPPVAAVIGGIGAQEVMKLLLGQYVPIGGTLIYDGSTQSMEIKPGGMDLIN